MFFETSYLPSPQFSTTSLDDSIVPELLSPTEEALPPPQLDDAAEETPVNHLVFVIHGIGQQTEQYGHFYEHVENLQETTRQVLQAKVPDHNVRIELIPIEWHRHIHDQVDPILNRITLKSIPTIRLIENEYLADVLFYFSKDRGQSIIDNVTHLFNTSYHNFMEKHPDFDGKIVILGYSLGGILTWDILAHQRQPSSPEEEQDYRRLDVVYDKLDFKPNYFFSLGSPIGAVLTFRNQSPVTYHPDYDIVFENLFHPFDPLAYRIEPLYDEYYTDQPAVLVERSVPIGPSFSFPSLPSLPGMGLFSFFSWKMSSATSGGQDQGNDESNNVLDESYTANEDNKKQADHTHNNNNNMNNSAETDDVSLDAKDNKQATPLTTSLQPSIVSNSRGTQEQPRNGPAPPMDENQGISIMTSLLQYFSKSRRGSKDISDSKNNSTTTSTTASEIGEQDHELPTPNDNMHGIITWDPLQEQRRAVLSSDISSHITPASRKISMAENDDDKNNTDISLDHSTSSSTANSISRRPLQRAKTYCAQGTNDNGGSMLFYEIDKSDYTVTTYDDGFSISEHTNTHGDNNSGNKQNSTTEEKPHPKLRHLVEVLGIDGVRMESFERAKANFPRTTAHSNNTPLSGEDGNKETLATESDNIHNDTYCDIATLNKDNSSHHPFDQAKATIREGITAYTTTPEDDNNSTHAKSKVIETEKDTLRQSEHQGDEEKKDQPTVGTAGTASVKDDDDDTTKKAQQEQEAQVRLSHLPSNRRIDFALQPDGFMSMIANEYIVGLRAHFSYWTSKDLMWHILQTLEK